MAGSYEEQQRKLQHLWDSILSDEEPEPFEGSSSDSSHLPSDSSDDSSENCTATVTVCKYKGQARKTDVHSLETKSLTAFSERPYSSVQGKLSLF